jgi:hypothetical protein
LKEGKGLLVRLILVVIVTGFLAMFCASAFAEENAAKKKAENLPWDKASISLGSFVSSTNSKVYLSANGVGIGIDVEEALGIDTTTSVFRAGGIWRFSDNRRHRAELSWFAIRRDGSRQLGQDIIIDGVTYPTGTQVNSGFDLDVYKATYSYSFFQDDRMDIGAGVGLYIMPLRFEFSASGLVSGQVSEAVTAPLPVFGLRGDFVIAPKWILKSKLDLFYLEYKQYKGMLYDTSVGVEYKAFKRVGFGLAVENFTLAIEAEGEDYPGIDFMGKIEYQYLGAMLYASFYF